MHVSSFPSPIFSPFICFAFQSGLGLGAHGLVRIHLQGFRLCEDESPVHCHVLTTKYSAWHLGGA